MVLVLDSVAEMFAQTRVLLISDCPVVLSRMRRILERIPGIVFAGNSATCTKAQSKLARQKPDVILVSGQVSRNDINQLAKAARKLGYPRKIVCTSMKTTDTNLQCASGKSLVGCPLIDETPGDIIARVQDAMHGNNLLNWIETKELIDPNTTSKSALSHRELQILRLITEGLSNKEAAQTLAITERTIEFHVSSIFKKLGVRSRVQAAIWFVRHNFDLPRGC